MGAGGILGSQALAEKVNQAFSEVFVTPATGFSGLSLVGMEGVALNGVPLTPAQAAALNGQATLGGASGCRRRPWAEGRSRTASPSAN
jgi:hypothetical protein